MIKSDKTDHMGMHKGSALNKLSNAGFNRDREVAMKKNPSLKTQPLREAYIYKIYAESFFARPTCTVSWRKRM